jgi:hypothetical protein
MSRKSYIILLIILFCLPVLSNAQNRHRHYSETYYAIGAEVNPFPFISGGYYGSLWWGVSQIRIRATGAYTSVPGFLVSEGFEQNKIRSYSLLGDYFFNEAFKGFWAGGGFEYWDGSVVNSDDKLKGKYTNYVLTFDVGYLFKIWNNFYVSPSGSIHMVVAGEKVVEVGNATYNSSTISPSITITIGYHYRL